MTRTGQIVVLVLVGAVGLAVGVWGAHSCVTMQPTGVYIMQATFGDDDTLAVCSFHPSIGSYFRRAGFALGGLAGAFMIYLSASSLVQMRKR